MEPNRNEIRSIRVLSRTDVHSSTMNLCVTGQSQNKWGMVSIVNEQKEHKFESIKPILHVYSLTPNILCNSRYWKYLNLVERVDLIGASQKKLRSVFQTTSPEIRFSKMLSTSCFWTNLQTFLAFIISFKSLFWWVSSTWREGAVLCEEPKRLEWHILLKNIMRNGS